MSSQAQASEGPRKTTGSTGARWKAGDCLSRRVLMGREACPRPPAEPCAHSHGPPGSARRRLRESFRCRFLLWLVAMAGLKHPFPSRTRPSRAPAAMILRLRARESSAPPAVFFQAPQTRGFFFNTEGTEAQRHGEEERGKREEERWKGGDGRERDPRENLSCSPWLRVSVLKRLTRRMERDPREKSILLSVAPWLR